MAMKVQSLAVSNGKILLVNVVITPETPQYVFSVKSFLRAEAEVRAAIESSTTKQTHPVSTNFIVASRISSADWSSGR